MKPHQKYAKYLHVEVRWKGHIKRDTQKGYKIVGKVPVWLYIQMKRRKNVV